LDSGLERLGQGHLIRRPKEYVVAIPGDIVEIDTMDVRPLPGVVIKHFTARDVVSRWDVIKFPLSC